MKKIEYFCNMCRDKKEQKDLQCMWWVSAKIPQGWEMTKLGTGLDKSDIHICFDCVKLVKNS